MERTVFINKDWLSKKYLEEEKTANEIAKEAKCHSSTIYRRLKKYNIPVRIGGAIKGRSMPKEQREKISKSRKGKNCGKNNPQWKGGKRTNEHNISIRNPTHHRADKNGYVLEHILVAEKKYNRPIKKGEIIHHIDLDWFNNNPNNLFVYKNIRDHNKVHRQLQNVAIKLFKLGIIKFDKKRGEYINIFIDY